MTMEERAAGLNQILEREKEQFRIVYEKIAKENAFKECYVIVAKGYNANPIVYKDNWFELSDHEVIEYLKDIAMSHLDNISNPEKLATKEYVTSHVYPRLVSQMDDDIIKEGDLSVIPYLDMHIIMSVTVNENKEGLFSYKVTNHLLYEVGMTANELLDIAVDNLSKEICIITMDEMLARFKGTVEAYEGITPMYILSNRGFINGAAGILCKNALSEMHEKIGRRFYILPSSTHEIIALSSELDATVLKEIVKNANLSVVSPSDRLSDSIYVCIDGDISIA